jgi:hypothetical protein
MGRYNSFARVRLADAVESVHSTALHLGEVGRAAMTPRCRYGTGQHRCPGKDVQSRQLQWSVLAAEERVLEKWSKRAGKLGRSRQIAEHGVGLQLVHGGR